MNDEKINAVLGAMTRDIEERERVADDAMHRLEDMGVSAREYKDACLRFSVNSFVVAYLRRLMRKVEEGGVKTAENLMRFHSYYQHTKGCLDDGEPLSVGQAAVAVILDGWKSRCRLSVSS